MIAPMDFTELASMLIQITMQSPQPERAGRALALVLISAEGDDIMRKGFYVF